jgi:hypothetical protein
MALTLTGTGQGGVFTLRGGSFGGRFQASVTPAIPIVSSGLVVYLDAGNPLSYAGTGTTWTDLSGNSNNGTLVNGPTYTSANGGSIVFDGVNDYATTGINSLPSGTQNRTTQIWFKRTNTGTVDVLFGYGKVESPNGGAFGAYVDGSNNIYFWSFNNDTSIAYTITTGVWYNLAFTLNSGVLIAYINGSQVYTFSPSISTVIVTSLLGANAYAAINTNNLHGNIAVYMIYNRALTSTEILQNFNANKTRYGL